MKKILIIEDVTWMLELIHQVLEEKGQFQVSGRASNTWEARIEIDRRRPDLVLLDEVLPGESSLDFLVELKELGIPIVLMTGMEKPTHPVPQGVLGRVLKPDERARTSETDRFLQTLENLTRTV